MLYRVESFGVAREPSERRCPLVETLTKQHEGSVWTITQYSTEYPTFRDTLLQNPSS